MKTDLALALVRFWCFLVLYIHKGTFFVKNIYKIKYKVIVLKKVQFGIGTNSARACVVEVVGISTSSKQEQEEY